MHFLPASALSFCYIMVMLPITVRKRIITEADLESIQTTVNEHWDKGRTPISRILCQKWPPARRAYASERIGSSLMDSLKIWPVGKFY